jgi:chromosome segregation ATPase
MAPGGRSKKAAVAALPVVAAVQQHWHVRTIRVCAFKSFPAHQESVIQVPSPWLVGITGANGCGKSSLLEAIAFATGAPASALRVPTLRALCNSAAPGQLCAVELQFSRSSGGLGASGAAAVNVRAALQPDGTRAFTVDGRKRTAAQVHELLHGMGVRLDCPTAVIKQAAVTHLADRNTPDAVHAVVADASGLTRCGDRGMV